MPQGSLMGGMDTCAPASACPAPHTAPTPTSISLCRLSRRATDSLPLFYTAQHQFCCLTPVVPPSSRTVLASWVPLRGQDPSHHHCVPLSSSWRPPGNFRFSAVAAPCCPSLVTCYRSSDVLATLIHCNIVVSQLKQRSAASMKPCAAARCMRTPAALAGCCALA